MAFIYLSGGQVLQVPPSKEAVENDLRDASDRLLQYEADDKPQSVYVSIVPAHIVAITDEPIPQPRATAEGPEAH